MRPKEFFLKNIFIFIAILIVSLTISNQASAQLQESDILLKTYPIYPKPGESVQATVNSFSTNLDKAFIVWSINGQEKTNGVGKKNFSFNLENAGEQTQISVSVTTINGNTIIKSIYLKGVSVDLLWEAVDSYVPPFYRGKALAVREGSFKIVAIAEVLSSNGRISPSNLSYTWKKDNDPQLTASGFGKDAFTFKNSYLDTSNEIEVKISDIENKSSAGGKIKVEGLKQPEILFYKKDPLLGVILSQTLNNGYTLGSEPETIVAIPYFFSPNDIKSNRLSLNWSAGGEKIKSNKKRNEVTVVAPTNEPGGTEIKVLIKNVNSLFQSLEKTINVNF